MLLLGASCGDDGRSAEPVSASTDTTLTSDHREVDLQFTSGGDRLAGTLFSPVSGDSHAAVVWVHGSGPSERLRYGPLVQALVESNVALFSYDKRGVGESEGECCPADAEDAGLDAFGEQADDAIAALDAVRSQPGVDPERIGFLGVSQAGWIVPIAASRSDAVAFTVLVSAPTVTTGEEALYSSLTGDADITDAVRRDEISAELASHPDSGFDPAPFLQKMTSPGLWLYGSVDGSVPVPESIAVLDRLKAGGRNITYVVFPTGGHGLLDVDPPPPRDVLPTITGWLSDNGFT